MMYPFNLSVCNQVGLFKLADVRYQPIKKGPIDSIMVGHEYVLVQKDIAEYFKSLNIERVMYSPAIIWDRPSNVEYDGYVELLVNHHFCQDQINDLDIDGRQFLIMNNEYLFVTPELKNILECSDFGFEFTEGLSYFG